MPEKIGLQAVLEDKQFNQGLANFMKGVDQMSKATGRMEKSSSKMAGATDDLGSSLGDAGLEATEYASKIEIVEKAMEAATQVAGEMVELAKLGAQAERAEKRFEAFAGQVGDSTEILEAFQRGAGGTVDKMGAMNSASRLLQMGLVTNADEMETVVEMATRLGDQTVDATTRVSDFALMLANQSIPRLDNFGIASGKVRKRIEELQAANADMGRDTAFMIATMEEGQKSLEILGDRVDDNAAAFERAEAKMADARVELGKKLAPVLAKVMGLVADLSTEALGFVTVLGTAIPLVLKFGGGLSGLASASKFGAAGVGALGVGLGILAWRIDETSKSLDAMNAQHQEAVQVADDWRVAIAEQIDAGVPLLDVLDQFAEKTNKTTELWNNNIVTSTALGAALGTHNKILEVYTKTEQSVNDIIVANTKDYKDYQEKLARYNDQVDDANAKVPMLTKAQHEAATAALDLAQAEEEAARATEIHAEWVANATDETGNYTRASARAILAVRQERQGRERLAEKIEAEAQAEEDATRAKEAAEEAAEQAAKDIEDLAKAQEHARQAAFDHAAQLLTLAERMTGIDRAGLARAAIRELTALWEANIISEQEWVAQVTIIQDQFGLVTKQGRFYAKGLEALNVAVIKNRLSSDEYVGALKVLEKRAKAGQFSIADFLVAVGAGPEIVKEVTLSMDDLTGATEGFFQRLYEFDPVELAEKLEYTLSPMDELGRSTATLTAELGYALPPMDELQTSTERLKGGLEHVLPPTDELEQGMARLTEKLGWALPPMDELQLSADGLRGSLDDVLPPTDDLSDGLDDALPSADAMVLGAGRLTAGMTSALSPTDELKAGTERLKRELEWALSPLDELQTSTGGYKDEAGLALPPVDELKEGVGELGGEFGAAFPSIDEMQTSTEGFSGSADDAAPSVDDLMKEIGKLTEKTELAFPPIDDTTESTEKLKEGLEWALPPMDELTGGTSDLTGETEKASKPIDAITQSAEDVAAAMEATLDPMERMKESAKEIPETFFAAGAAMQEAGSMMVDKLKRGWEKAWASFIRYKEAALELYMAEWPSSEPKDPKSPLRNLWKVGAAMMNNVAEGFDESTIVQQGYMMATNVVLAIVQGFEDNAERIDELFRAGGIFSGLGGIAAQILRREMKDTGNAIETIEDRIAAMGKQFGIEGRDYTEVLANMRRAMRDWEFAEQLGLGGMDIMGLTRMYATQILPLLSERNKLTREEARQQEQLLKLQEAQQQLAFLRQQFELMKMIQEYGLDPAEILGGLELGVTADAGKVIAAMVAAMKRIIEAAQEEMGISSASKVMKKIGTQAMAGMAQGIALAAHVPLRQSALATQAVIAGAQTTIGGTEIQIGPNTITDAAEGQHFEQRVQRAVSRGIRRIS